MAEKMDILLGEYGIDYSQTVEVIIPEPFKRRFLLVKMVKDGCMTTYYYRRRIREKSKARIRFQKFRIFLKIVRRLYNRQLR